MPTHSNIHTLNGRSSRHSPSSSQQAVLPAEPYAYIRVSTLPQKMRGFSLPRQFRLCNEAAIADGVGPIPGGNLLHDADSGKNFHRGALQELLHRAGQGRISVVYFTKVDRIGRNARDSLEIVEHLQRCGVKMVILDPRIDTTGMFGKFFFTMLAAMAEL